MRGPYWGILDRGHDSMDWTALGPYENNRAQYSTVRLEQARLVSCLLYGTLFLIVKCTSGGLQLKMFVFPIHLWNFGKISIFLASSGSFNVKNDNIHTFFFAVLVANFEFTRFASQQKYMDWTISMETVRTAKSWPKKNQSEHRDLPKTGFIIIIFTTMVNLSEQVQNSRQYGASACKFSQKFLQNQTHNNIAAFDLQ